MTKGLICARTGLGLSFSSESRYFPTSLLPGQNIRGLERRRHILKGRQGTMGLGFTPEVGLGLVPTLVLFPPSRRTDSAPCQTPPCLAKGLALPLGTPQTLGPRPPPCPGKAHSECWEHEAA